MARRKSKFRKQFLQGTVVVGVLALAGGSAAYWKLKHKDPNKYVNAGDQYLLHHDYVDALAAYTFASSLRPTDPQLHLKVAKVHDQMRDQDFYGHITAAVEEYTRAEELQTDLKEAWQGLLECNMTWAEGFAQNSAKMQEMLYLVPERFGIAREAAQQLLKIDPSDSHARAAIPILTINLWLSHLSIPLSAEERALPVDKQPTEVQLIDRAVSELNSVMRDRPDDAEIPYWIAQAKIEEGVRLMQQANGDATAGTPDANGANETNPAQFGGDRSADLRNLFGAAAVVFDDAIARRPNSAQLQYKKYEVLTHLLQVDHDPEASIQYQAKQRAALDAAQSLITPADTATYAGYKGKWAEYLSARDPAAAEAVYKQLLARPTTAPATPGSDLQRLIEDTQVRIQYARMVSRIAGRRGDALAILEPVPTVAPAGIAANYQSPVGRLLAAARLVRAQILIDQVEASGNPSTQSDKAKAAQAEIDAVRANSRYAGDYEVLKTQGRLQLVTGAFRDAIQTLSAASDRLAGNGAGTDYDLLAWQAAAYASAHEPGEAIKLLEQAVRNPPGSNMMQPHVLLAKLYIDQQDYDDGRKQVSWLTERYPEDVRTIHLQILAQGRDGDPKVIADLYNRLPERNPPEQADKAEWAANIHNLPDAERLDELLYAGRPGDPALALRLANLYNATGNKGRANQVLRQAMDSHPESRGSLQLVLDSINGASQDALHEEVLKQVGTFKDPLVREVALYKLAHEQHQLAEEIDHMEKARALQPDNRKVLSDLFLGYLSASAFDKAEAMLPHLIDLDVDQYHGSIFKFRLGIAKHDNQAALAAAQQATHDFPHFATSWAALGEAYQASGQLETACQQYAASLDRQGNAPDIVERLVDCLIRLGRLDEARRILTDARRKFPDVAVYRKQSVQVEVAYGDPEAVLPIVDGGVATQPEVSDNWQSAVQAYAAAAQRRTAKGDVEGATRFIDHACQLLTDALKRWPDDAQFAGELGDLQAHDGTDAGVAAAAATFKALAATPEWDGQALPEVMTGRMYLQAKRPESAEAPLRHALELNPQATDARVALADSYFERHQPQAALDVLAPAKDQPAARARYVELLLALNRGSEAESDLLGDLKAHPDDPVPGNLLAQVYVSQGKFDAAQQVADQAIKDNPSNTGAYFLRGAAEASRTPPDLDGANKDLEIFRNAHPDNVQGRMALARVLIAKHEVEPATRDLEAAVNITPDAKDPRMLLARAYMALVPPRTSDAEHVMTQALTLPALAHDPDVQRVAAAVYLKAGENDKAVASIRDAMAHVDDQRTMLDDYLNILLATKNYDLVLSESTKFIDDPKSTWLLFDFRGRARAASGDVPGAMTEFATALDRAGAAPELTPAMGAASDMADGVGFDRMLEAVQPRSENSANWKAVLANCYNRAGKQDKALAELELVMPTITTFQPADQVYLNRLAAQLYMTAVPPQVDRAVALFKDVLKLAPNDLDSLNNLACLLAEQVHPPQLQEALSYSRTAVNRLHALEQLSPALSDTYGWLLILNGRLDEGIDVLHQIVDGATFPDAHYHLAEAYLRKGMMDDARRELAAAAQMVKAANANHPLLDRTLSDKIAAAQKRADQGVPSKPQAQAGP